MAGVVEVLCRFAKKALDNIEDFRLLPATPEAHLGYCSYSISGKSVYLVVLLGWAAAVVGPALHDGLVGIRLAARLRLRTLC